MKLAELLRLLLNVAFRNLWLYRLRTTVIAGLLGFGALLDVLGLSLLGDVETSMRRSISESIAGDIQIYSDKAKDDLALFGGNFMGRTDNGVLSDLVPFRDEALKHPNVEAFVPMGIDMALLGRGNEMDDSLDALRAALKLGDPGIVKDRVEQLGFQFAQLRRELDERRKLRVDQAQLDLETKDLELAASPAFTQALNTYDEEKLQFLETKIAPLSGEKQPIYLQYLGTDIELFKSNFAKFRVVEGDELPPGRRGILVSKKVREDFLKNIVARLFDRLNKRITTQGVAIKGDSENERDAKDLPRQFAQIVSHLDRAEAEALSTELSGSGIKSDNSDLIARVTEQLKTFLVVDDGNFADRHKWFFEHVAPRIKLYELSPGETITLRSYTRSGYLKSVPVKVYGVYTFEGLESSDLAGAMNIIDLVSFRELYGQMTDASRQELSEMRARAGLKAVDQASAEDQLFGTGAGGALEQRAEEQATSGVAEALQVKPTIPDVFDPKELSAGLAINAAIKLKDPRQLPRTMKELADAYKAKGEEVRVVDWQQASGIVGQFVNIVRLALVFAIVVIFIVALVIINNTIIVGTLNRIREIGTMRAIGAQRTFVVGLFLAETGITGFMGAFLGAIAAAFALLALGQRGIPAGNDVLTFLFSGPRLYPTMRWDIVIASPFIITLVATVASIYAARHAARVKPAEAMQEKE